MKNKKRKYNIIYCDMDGVLVDLSSSLLKLLNDNIKIAEDTKDEYLSALINKAFESVNRDYFVLKDTDFNGSTQAIRELSRYLLSNNFEFWANLKWLEGGEALWSFLKDKNVRILSSPIDSSCMMGKRKWTLDNLGIEPEKVFFSHQKELYAKSDAILIDDLMSNIMNFKRHGGTGIVYITTTLTVSILKSIL